MGASGAQRGVVVVGVVVVVVGVVVVVVGAVVVVIGLGQKTSTSISNL